jgi:hypothetical protein
MSFFSHVSSNKINQISSALADMATAHVKSYGAKGDGVTDDTSAIQAAINYVNSQGGGTVLLGKGTFKYTSLILYSNVRLQGMNALVDSNTRVSGTNPFPTILYPTDTNNPSIKAYSFSSIDGICFFYKDQKTTLTSSSDDFIHYPATIQLGDRNNGIHYAHSISITNCIPLASYIFIEQSAVHCEKLNIKNIRGSVLNKFLHLKRMTDVSHVENVHINVNSLENWFDGDSNYITKIAQTCVMFYLARCDEIVISDCFAFGVKNMVFFYQEGDSYYADTGGGGGCTLLGTSADNVNQFLRIDRSMMSIGIRVIGGYCCPIVPVTGMEQAVVAYSVNANNTNVVFKGFRSFGTTYAAIPNSRSTDYIVVFEDANPTVNKNNICVLDGLYQDYLTSLVKNENVTYLNTCMVSGLLNQRSMLQTQQLTINGNNGQISADYSGIHLLFSRPGINYIQATGAGSSFKFATNNNGDNNPDLILNNYNVQTKNNTLDDGVNGNITARGSLNGATLNITGPSGTISTDSSGAKLQFSRTGNNYIKAIGASGSLWFITNNNAETAPDLTLINKQVKTANNTLDDGVNGNMIVKGYLTVGNVASLPTPSSTYRGQIILVLGNGTSTADTFYICLQSATGTYSWKQIMTG